MKTLKQFLIESPTSEQAERLGLTYFGFGKYGKEGSVTHVVRFGRLVPVTKASSHLNTSKEKLTHLEHVEDEMFNNGIHGVRNALNSLHAVRDYFKHKGNEIKLNVKVDGSPSTVISAEHGKTPYVATKSAFNANPKLNYSHADIEKNHPSEGLQNKLKVALDHLPKVVKGGTYQGDLLYTHDDIQVKNIDGVAHYVFKPNVLTYAVPVNSSLGRKIAKSKIGIVIHTQYKDGKASFDPEMEHFNYSNPDALVLSNDMANTTLNVSPEEEHTFNSLLSTAGKHFQSIEKEAFDVINNPLLTPLFKTYINAKVREGSLQLSTNDFIKHVSNYFEKSTEKLKSQKTIDAKREQTAKIINEISSNKEHIDKLFKLHGAINKTKEHLITTLNKHQLFKTFLEKEGQLEPTDPEGYVVTTDTGALKLVNRLGFSATNFNANKK